MSSFYSALGLHYLCSINEYYIVEGGKDMGNRIYPIGIQNFEQNRKEGDVYVHKTAGM